MIKQIYKSGLFLSILALFWIAIPCESHCLLVSAMEKNSDSHCGSHDESDTSSSPCQSNNDSMQICHSNSENYSIPNGFDYTLLKSVVMHNSLIETFQSLSCTNYILNIQSWNIHSPPLEFKSQLLTTHLYTPHAPPTLS